MTFVLFIALMTALAALSSGLTEAIKAAFGDKHPDSTLLNGIVSSVVGLGGTAAAYVILKIPFTDAVNIILMIIMPVAIWLSSTLGYDKVMQIITNFKKLGD